jgi:hypothetical protein
MEILVRARTHFGMPVYEIVLHEPGLPQKVSFSDRAATEIGDVVMVDGRRWIVVEKDPPFELRRIERLICQPVSVALPHEPR